MAREQADAEININGLFRRPEKYRIGEDFDLFFRKTVLYFDAIDLTDERKKRLALLFNLSEDAFRLAESVPLPSCNDPFDAWGKEIATRFEKNQTATERRYTFSKRMQLPGETVDAYSVSLRGLAAKCDFQGGEYDHRLLDQFILGIQHKGTQNRLLQEPPSTVDEAIAVARRYEAAKSTLDTLKHENVTRSAVINPVKSGKTCFNCHKPGHIARDCARKGFASEEASTRNIFCFNCKRPGHMQYHCPLNYNKDGNRSAARQGNQNDGLICFRCHKRGHVARSTANWDEINTGLSSSKPVMEEHGRNVSKLSSVAGSEKRTTLVLEGIIEGSRVLCVLDTGASICLMSKGKWNKLRLSKELFPSDVVAEAANNMPLGILGRSKLQFECAGLKFEQEFYIVEHMAHEILIGLNWMLENKVNLQVGERKLLFEDGSSCDLFLRDASLMYPGVVEFSLSEDLDVPAGHEVVCPAKVKNPFVENETEGGVKQDKDPIKYLAEPQEKQKKAYDERVKTNKSKRLLPGDTVILLYNTSRGSSEKYIGPFMIIDTEGCYCQIESLLNGKKKMVHYNRLKPCDLAIDEEQLYEFVPDIASDLESSDADQMERPITIRRRPRRNDSTAEESRKNEREPEITFVEQANENISDRPFVERRASTRNKRPIERFGISVNDY